MKPTPSVELEGFDDVAIIAEAARRLAKLNPDRRAFQDAAKLMALLPSSFVVELLESQSCPTEIVQQVRDWSSEPIADAQKLERWKVSQRRSDDGLPSTVAGAGSGGVNLLRQDNPLLAPTTRTAENQAEGTMTEIRYPLADGEAAAAELLKLLDVYCERISVAGSIRRRKPDIGDIELLCIPKIDIFGRDRLDARIRELIAVDVLALRLNVKGNPTYGPWNKYLVDRASGIPLDVFSTTA